jgi:hypothetical protein
MAVRTRERTSLENTKAIKCAVCRKDYTPECNFNQGRCPHHPPMLNMQPRDTSKGHFYVSLVKSIIRIGAGGCLIQGNLLFAGFLLIFAEVLGIVEELV